VRSQMCVPSRERWPGPRESQMLGDEDACRRQLHPPVPDRFS
jgi:hypothetical protein